MVLGRIRILRAGLILLIAGILAACGGSDSDVELPTLLVLPSATDVPPTATDLPTLPPTWTLTPTLSPTITLTVTPSLTITDTPTRTATATPTDTLEPNAVNPLVELARQQLPEGANQFIATPRLI